MTDATTRPAWLWFPVGINGLVGGASLFSLLRLLFESADLTLPEYLFVALWAVGPLLIGFGLLRGRRWAWWLGLAAPLLYVTTLVGEMVLLLVNSDGGLVGIAGGILTLLPIVGIVVASLCLLAPSVRKHFAIRPPRASS